MWSGKERKSADKLIGTAWWPSGSGTEFRGSVGARAWGARGAEVVWRWGGWRGAGVGRVAAAVSSMLELVGLVRRGDRIDDGDTLLEVAESVVEAVGGLKDGIEKVQANVVSLEGKVKVEVLPLKDEIVKMSTRMSIGESAVQGALVSVSAMGSKMA